MKKVWILYTSTGMWDDYMVHIVGVYTSPEQADEAKRLWEAQVQEYNNRYTQERKKELIAQMDELDEELWSAEMKDYDKWETLKTDYSDGWVVEVETDKQLMKP